VGIVKVKTTGYNQDGETVITFLRTVMVYRRDHAPSVARPVPEE
jgi:itaconyl-CoA hydratase